MLTNCFILILFLKANGTSAGGVITIPLPSEVVCTKALESAKHMKTFEDGVCIYSRTGEAPR